MPTKREENLTSLIWPNFHSNQIHRTNKSVSFEISTIKDQQQVFFLLHSVWLKLIFCLSQIVKE